MDGSAADYVRAIAAAEPLDLGWAEVPFPHAPIRYRSECVEIDISVERERGRTATSRHAVAIHKNLFSGGYRPCIRVESRPRANILVRARPSDNLDHQGLAGGMDRETALVIGPEGYLTAARMPDEMVTHKLLDLVGDLFLLGIPARYLDVRACCSGHRTNVDAARMATLV